MGQTNTGAHDLGQTEHEKLSFSNPYQVAIRSKGAFTPPVTRHLHGSVTTSVVGV